MASAIHSEKIVHSVVEADPADFCQGGRTGAAGAAAACFGTLNSAAAARVCKRMVQPRPLEGMSAASLFDMIREGARERDIEAAFAELAERPFSLEIIEGLIRRRGMPICPAERALMRKLKRSLPDLNKALVSWELLRRETEKMDLSRFRGASIEAGGESFPVYGTRDGSYKYLVYAVGVNRGSIEERWQKKLASGFICASLISDQGSDLYSPNQKYGMVVAADPRSIVATSREDAYTPYMLDDPGTMEFYRFYQRLQLLTSYVDKLYREIGVSETPALDGLSSLNRLRSLEEQGVSLPGAESLAQSRQRTILGKESSYEEIQIHYKKFGLARQKIREIEEFLQAAPGLADERQEAELRRCKRMLEEISGDSGIFHLHMHPIQGVDDLIGQTGSQQVNNYNQLGTRPYNEVNLDLEAPPESGVDPIVLKAILIDEEAFRRSPDSYWDVLRDATAKGIPILLREAPVLSPQETRNRFLQDARKGRELNLARGVDSGHIDGETAGRALLLAIESRAYSCASQIMIIPGIPERYLREAFYLTVGKRDDFTLGAFLKEIPGLIGPIAAEYASGGGDWFPSSLVEFIFDRGLEISPETAGRILIQLMPSHTPHLVRLIYEAYKDRIPREQLDLIFSPPDLGSAFFCMENIPPEEVEGCAARAIERRDAAALRKLFGKREFRALIPTALAEKALKFAEAEGAGDLVVAILRACPQFEDRWAVYFQDAIEKRNGYKAYYLYSHSEGRLKEAAIAALPFMEQDNFRARFLNELFPDEREIPAVYAGECLKAAVDERCIARAVRIDQLFRCEIDPEKWAEIHQIVVQSGNIELIVHLLPREQINRCFRASVERGQWFRALDLAKAAQPFDHILREEFEAAVSSAIESRVWVSDVAELVECNPDIRERLRAFALKKAIEMGERSYLEKLADRFGATPGELQALNGGKPLSYFEEQEFSKFTAADFEDLAKEDDAPNIQEPEDLDELAAEMGALQIEEPEVDSPDLLAPVVQTGSLGNREVTAQHRLSIGSLPGLAAAALRAPFHLLGWASSGLLKACRKK